MTTSAEDKLIEDQMAAELAAAEVPPPSAVAIPELTDPVAIRMQHDLDVAEHDTLPQQLLTTVEGGAEGLLGPGAALGERLLSGLGVPGLTPKDQELRKEASPYLRGGSEAATFLGGALTGTGLPAVLEKAGVLGTQALGRAVPMVASSKIGSKAVQGFIENGLFQSGNEISKLINNAPESVGSALANVGLMGAIGGALSGGPSVVSSMWKKTAGARTGGVLKSISDKLGGIEGQATDPINEIINRTGMDIAPEVVGSLSEDRHIAEIATKLLQTDTSTPAIKFQEKFHESIDEIGDVLSRTLGKEPTTIPKKLDKYSEGNLLGKTLAEESRLKIEPQVKAYENLAAKSADIPILADEVKQVPIPSTMNNPYIDPKFTTETVPGTVNMIRSRLNQLAQDERWVASKSSDIMKEFRRVMGDLDGLKTVGDIGALIKSVNSKIRQHPYGDNTFRYQAGKIVGELVESEADAIQHHVMAKLDKGAQSKFGFAGPENIATQFESARKGYKEAAQILSPLMDRLKLQGSIHGFPKRLKEMALDDAEGVLRKLSGKNDAVILEYLAKEFPETAAVLRGSYINEILSDARITDTSRISPFRVMKSLNDLSPQLKAFVTQGSSEKIGAIGEFISKVKDLYKNYNWSNTGRTVQKNEKHNRTAAISVAAWLMGHGPIDAVVGGLVGNHLLRETPDAARVALLKWLGSSKPIDAGAFKSSVEFIQQTIKGENLIKNASKAVFSTGSKVVPEHLLPKKDELKELDKKLKEIQINPSSLEKMGNLTGYYLDKQGVAIAAQVAQAAQYVNSQRPAIIKSAPLDPEIEPSGAQQEAFNQVLTIAQQPLVVLEYMKKGTLTTQDLQHLNNMYPSLYPNIKNKLTSEMVDYLSEGKTVPYQTRFGLSMFFGQPLDSSFAPQSVQSNQNVFMQAEANEQAVKPTVTGLGKNKESKRLSLTPSDSGA